MLNRRDMLNLSVRAGGLSSLLPCTASPADEDSAPAFPIIDSNVSLFRWPFRRLPLDETDKLVRKLRSLGVKQAWAGSFEGLLHRDVSRVNPRLAEVCKGHKELLPFGSINPMLPDWEGDLQQCVDVHRMPGVRLHPNYHGYSLGSGEFLAVLKKATAAGRLVQIAVAMEDTRTQHSKLRVPDVDLAPLPNVMQRVPQARVQLLNWYRPRPPLLDEFARTPGLFVDISRADGTDSVPGLVERLPPGCVLFGSHAPFLIPEAALIRVHESGLLDESALRRVYSSNAEAVLKEGRS